MRIIVIFFIIFFNIISLSSQEVKVIFKINDKEQNLNNNFSVYLLAKDSTKVIIYVPTIKHNTFILPDHENYTLLFILEYKNKYYTICSHSFNFDCNMIWEINYYDKKFFDKLDYNPILDLKNCKLVITICIRPLERYEGICTEKGIYNKSKFLKYGKKMIKKI
jgi:hypothetical protein